MLTCEGECHTRHLHLIQRVVAFIRPVEPSMTGIKMIKKLFNAKSIDQGVIQIVDQETQRSDLKTKYRFYNIKIVIKRLNSLNKNLDPCCGWLYHSEQLSLVNSHVSHNKLN